MKYAVAAWLDRWEPRGRRLAEKLGWPQAWLQEFMDYLDEPRMTPEEFWVRYTLKRMGAQPRITGELTEEQALAFYRESDYMLWRNLVHRRHSAWRRVLWTMRGRYGTLIEYGCGIAPVSAWVARRRPDWRYILLDIEESAHLKFARWRLRNYERYSTRPPYATKVVTALDVFEHLADPMKAARECVESLSHGGYLHANFVGNPRRNDLDLATPAQRQETLQYFRDTLELVWEDVGYCIWRKRAVSK